MKLSIGIQRKLVTYFTKKLGAYEYRRGWFKADCPECGDHKFGIHLEQNRTNCFKCEYRPKPIDLVVKLEKLETRASAYNLLKALRGARYFEPVVTGTHIEVEKTVVRLPESFKLLTLGRDKAGRVARNYMKRRGFDIEELSLQGVGYCSEGDVANHIVIPFYRQGELIYWIARRFRYSGPRYHNPPSELFQTGKSSIIYNIDSLYMFDECMVMEGALNSLIMGETAVSMQGKSLSAHQLNYLKRAPCPNYTIMLDKEAIHQAIRLALDLIKAGKNVRIVEFPDDRDPNDLGYDKTKELIDSSQWESYPELIKKKWWYEAHPEHTY